jgi:predicted CopG family antitoxin
MQRVPGLWGRARRGAGYLRASIATENSASTFFQADQYLSLDFSDQSMHDSCMATKTISLELDAYERLRKARRTPSESFSSVVRRAVFPGTPCTAAEVLEIARRRLEEGKTLLSLEMLSRLDAAQKNPRSSESHWTGQ